MNLEPQVKKTLKKINLSKHEKILVALSGGKDSSITVYLLKKLGYSIEGIHIYLGLGKYSDECLDSVKNLCKDLGIKLHVYNVEKETGKSMLEVFKKIKGKGISNCVACGTVKKWILNKKARQLKAKKVATGHHLDDELETFVMNILKGSPKLSSNFGPILDVKDKKFVPRLKPLFFVPEKEIRSYVKKEKIKFVSDICPYRGETYRVEVRHFIGKLSCKEKDNLLKNAFNITKNITERGKVDYCKICGEPSRKTICQRCSLIQHN